MTTTAPAETTPARMIVAALVARRKELGLRQCDVGERMAVGQPTVCRFEVGLIDPHLSTLLRYASAVGVTLTIVGQDGG